MEARPGRDDREANPSRRAVCLGPVHTSPSSAARFSPGFIRFPPAAIPDLEWRRDPLTETAAMLHSFAGAESRGWNSGWRGWSAIAPSREGSVVLLTAISGLRENLMIGGGRSPGPCSTGSSSTGATRFQDLGYLCVRAWRFGGEQPVGGFGTYEDLFRGYETRQRFRDGRPRVRSVVGSVRNGLVGKGVCMPAGVAPICRDQSARSSSRQSAGACGSRSTTCCWRWRHEARDPLHRGSSPRPCVSFFQQEMVGGATDGRLSFHARVAANVLAPDRARVAGVGLAGHHGRTPRMWRGDPCGPRVDFAEVYDGIRENGRREAAHLKPTPPTPGGPMTEIPADPRGPLSAGSTSSSSARSSRSRRSTSSFFDHRREWRRNRLGETTGVHRREWLELLAEIRRRSDQAGLYRYRAAQLDGRARRHKSSAWP